MCGGCERPVSGRRASLLPRRLLCDTHTQNICALQCVVCGFGFSFVCVSVCSIDHYQIMCIVCVCVCATRSDFIKCTQNRNIWQSNMCSAAQHNSMCILNIIGLPMENHPNPAAATLSTASDRGIRFLHQIAKRFTHTVGANNARELMNPIH